MSLRVFWSDRLETMADRILDEWTARLPRDPFERTCVVVGDMATRNWLKERFLLRREPGARRVLANVDFKPLPEFANDWLAAAVHGREGAEARDPAEHPFSQGVMAWRIDAILREKAGDPAFATLADYVAAGGAGAEDFRRFDLAVRLAQMFDDYLVSRHATLLAWERGVVPPAGDERWQALLYRELARGAGPSYAADYAKALGPDVSASAAFENGFPRYAAVHVFDVLDAPWPYLEMLKKISEEIPVSFWTFNPLHDFWMENPTKRQLLREKADRIRRALADGKTPEEEKEDPDFSSPDARLLGALATGARGLLAQELDLAGGNYEWMGGDGGFSSFRGRGFAAEVHACHSARRELEAARDALHRFFREHPDAKPSDALVLCADWKTYSPLVEAVFGGEDAKGGDGAKLPVATAGIRSSTPIAHSFGELLDFRTNRFEASKVFSLLGVPEIRGKFGIGADGLPVLREMVRDDNVHWGWDDEDVRDVLGQAPGDGGERNRFTWRRGLDRLVLDALLGPREDEDALYEAGELGSLLPCGHVESDRAELVGGLHRFATRLAALRRFLKKPHTADEWRGRLLSAVDDFYETPDSALGEILGLRKAVETAAAAAVRARGTNRRAAEEIPGDVFCRAVLDAVNDGSRPLSSSGDAVRVAPLANGSAVPARFVWICGLNDGFPREEYRPSFDLVGRHPTMFDVTPRERNALALLKGAMGARDRLCLSYVGRDVRTNAELPPAVPLTDLLEWFDASGIPVASFVHPLQSYGGRYFRGGTDLPPCYSAANRAAAAAIAAAREAGANAADAPPRIVPFPLRDDGMTEIDLDELAEFCGSPNRFLARRRLKLWPDDPKYRTFDDDDNLDGRLPDELSRAILVRGEAAAADIADIAEKLMESGVSLPEDKIAELVKTQVEGTADWRARPLTYRAAEAAGFQCENRTAAQALAEWQDSATVAPFHADLSVDGHSVSVSGACRTVPLDVQPSGTVDHEFFLSPYPDIYPSMKIGSWVRHVAAHAAGKRFVTAMMGRKDGPARTYRPLPRAEAEAILAEIVRQASRPVEFDRGKAGNPKEDAPSGALADALEGFETRLVSTQKPKGKKK